jgi:hypothetical protein
LNWVRIARLTSLEQSERFGGAMEPATALSRHTLIAAISGSTPMMFITRVML